LKAKVRWKPIGLSAKRWRETAHLKGVGPGPNSKPPKGSRLKAPPSYVWGQKNPRLEGTPRSPDGFPSGGENTL